MAELPRAYWNIAKGGRLPAADGNVNAAAMRLAGARGACYAVPLMEPAIISAFDSGNIRVIDRPAPDHFRLGIAKDADDHFFQWFHFRLSGARGRDMTLDLVGLEGSAFPRGWHNYRARGSADRRQWTQLPTSYDSSVDGGRLRILVRPESDFLWVAYFAPYSMERHHDLVAAMACSPGVSGGMLGRTLDGQSIDCLSMGEGPLQFWFYARQHPGETMAEWWMDGALGEMVDPASAVAGRLRASARLHFVPNLNPDGSRRGYLRTNAAGANLNREWDRPTPDRAPEIVAILAAMTETGVDFALDVHGDETIPHNFLAGFEGVSQADDRQRQIFARFQKQLCLHSAEFQMKAGYPAARPGTANLSMSTNQLAQRFGAVSATLEMPFKDADDAPLPETGWSPERSRRLAVACLAAVADLLDAFAAR
jgi:murein tripeptide amidase MpaA